MPNNASAGFGVIVVIATDATSAAFVKTSRRSTFVSTVLLRSMSFSCVLCVDFDTDAHTKGGGGGRRLEDEKKLFVVVLLVGVEMTTMLLVAAANIL